MWLNHKKHFWRKFIFLTIGVVVGLLLLNQYKAQKQVKQLTSRDSAISLVNQLQLSVGSNRELHEEIQKLKIKLEKLKEGVSARKEVQESMDSYRLLSGLDAVSGDGLEITVDLFLEPFWLVDFINELYIAGAERIALNDYLISDNTSFSSQDDVIYLNGNILLSAPFVFKTIGSYEQIQKSLKRPGSIMARLSSQFPGFDADGSMKKVKDQILPQINQE